MKYRGGSNISETVINVQNEFLFVGAIYKDPDLFIEHGQYIRSKYDFSDEATRFYYEMAEVVYQKRSQKFSETVITVFVTEDTERLKLYKKYGGWKTIVTWMDMAVLEDFKNYYDVLKKYSLLREYQRNGYDVDKIINHKKFELFSPEDIYRMIRGKVDRIQTVILTSSEGEILNSRIQETINKCMEVPDMGISIPYKILNDVFRGLKLKSMMAVGMLSNAGKSRFMCKLIAYVTLVLKEKVLVLLNEMTIEEMRYCLITTVINNPEFQKMHGIKLTKKEREITLGMYKDNNGEFIRREQDDWGDFTESIDDYINRVAESSDEYRKIKQISLWIEDETQGLIFAKDISASYDDRTLEFEIRKANLTQGINYCFYDTLKQDTMNMSDWAALKTTTTKLSEITKHQNIFVYGSIQLTDDAVLLDPDKLSSMNIANSKQLKHVLHTMVLFKAIDKTDYKYYRYLLQDADWGEPTEKELNLSKTYYMAVTDKNRFGRRVKVLFEVDLDYNTWIELGEVIRK